MTVSVTCFKARRQTGLSNVHAVERIAVARSFADSTAALDWLEANDHSDHAHELTTNGGRP